MNLILAAAHLYLAFNSNSIFYNLALARLLFMAINLFLASLYLYETEQSIRLYLSVRKARR